MQIDVLRQLLADAAASAEAVSLVEVEEARGWVVVLADENAVAAEYLDPPGILVASADVGALPERPDAERLLTLLRYNGAWRENGGLRLGLGAGDVVTLTLDLPLDDTDAPRLAGMLLGFADAASAWREAFTSMPDPVPVRAEIDMTNPPDARWRV